MLSCSAGVDNIRTILNDARMQKRALCLRHATPQSSDLQVGCPFPEKIDLDPRLNFKSVFATSLVYTGVLKRFGQICQ